MRPTSKSWPQPSTGCTSRSRRAEAFEEEYRVEYVCDRVQTFSTAFLGLTMECCRCHDHKFDPLTQKDYYQLFGMFQNIDEAGLYAYFTDATPTPGLSLIDDSAAPFGEA